ncbi:hypothetical protein MJT46_002140 [Ovis ammon polii x Ovis aries]|nr:hypothetical protein MJT46_002140 [Ovis ammon polii x Ovis aries]
MLQGNSTSEESVEEGRSGKDLRKKCLAIISPDTPAKLCSCILIIFILVALNVVMLSALVAARSRKPELKVLYVTCPEGWIGFGTLLTITGRLSRGNILFLLSLGRFWAVAISPGHGPFVREFGNREGKDLRKKCLAIISPVTPAKLCSCILIIFILLALNVVMLSALVAESKNWTFSQTSCTKMEAVLAQFEMEEELNFLKRYKGPSDHWIGLSRESSHHAWKWTDNSKCNASFVITGDGERGYLNDLGVSSARSYTDRKWICSKQIMSLNSSRPY